MAQLGIDVYDAIQLVESHCVYQMSRITHECRSLIPVDSKRRYHLKSSLITLNEQYRVDVARSL